MPLSVFDPVDEDQANRDIYQTQKSVEQLKQTATPEVSQRISEIYKRSPYIPASVILAMAKNGSSQETVDAVQKLAGQTIIKPKPKKQSWFERNVYGKLKAASRWSFAGLQLLPDLVQNAAAEAFSPNDPAGTEGWFKSTQLGTMLANHSSAGTGFFMGDEAAKTQAQRARDFRGTIKYGNEYHAWTIGRGAASVAFAPGSKAFNIMSGFLDASVNVLADPTGPLGSKVRNIAVVDELLPNVLRTATSKTSRAAIPGVADELTLSVAKKMARGEAGLTAAETFAFEQSKFGKWVTSHPGAKRLSTWISSVAADSTLSLETKTRIILENIDGLSPEVAKEFAQADDISKVHGVLGEASARLANNPDDLLLPKDIRDVRKASAVSGVTESVRSWLDDTIGDRQPFHRTGRKGRLFSQMPEQSVIINGSGLDRTRAIKTYANYLRGTGFDENGDEFKGLMDQVTRAFTNENKFASRADAHKAHHDIFEAVYKKAGGSKEDAKTIVAQMRAKVEERLLETRSYTINEAGHIDDAGFLQMLLPHVNKDEVLKNFSPDTWDKLTMISPGALVEMADDVMVLPDFREMRALTGKMAFAKKSKTIDSVNTLVAFTQNEIWKPLTLATGGYVMRNMLDAQTRMAMEGLASGFRNPVDLIMWVTRRKGKFDIKGNEFDNTIRQIANGFDSEMSAFHEALTYDMWRHMDDSVSSRSRAMATGNFSQVERGANRDAHTSAYVGELRRIFTDPVLNRVARIAAGDASADEKLQAVKEWLTSPEGQEQANGVRRLLQTGVKFADPQSGRNAYLALGEDIPDDVLHAWVDRLSTMKVNTIVRGDEELRIVAAHNRVPLTRRVNGELKIYPKETVDVEDVTDFISGAGEPGSIVRLFGPDGEYEGLVVGSKKAAVGEVDPFSPTGALMEPKEQLIIQPVHPGEAVGETVGSQALRDLIDAKGDEGKLASIVKRSETATPKDADGWEKAQKSMRRFTGFFFERLYGSMTATLEKSPVFRQFYYREVLDTADLLNPVEARQLLDNILVSAEKEGMSASRYVGDKKVLDKLKTVANQPVAKTVLNVTADVSDDFVSKQERYAQTLRQNVIETLSNFKSRGFKTINKGLREFQNVPEAAVIDAVIDGAPSLGKDTVLYRGVSGEFAENLLSSQPGKIVSDPAFVSVSSKSTIARDFAENGVVLEISAPAKTKAMWMDSFIDPNVSSFENELLLPRGTRMRVLSVDGKTVRVEIVDSLSSVATGTIDDLDGYAKASALRQTQDLLYNASSRNNLEDMLRVIVPFGSAWKEVLSTYASAIIEDPSRLRRAQLVFKGATNFDPDNDGQGFFYKDATTGEYSFNFPLSGWVSELITGTETPLQAPVKRLSIGLGVLPSIGPVAQIGTSTFIPDTPTFDNVVKLLLPYGRKSSVGFIPTWAKRMGEAWDANTQNLQSVYGNTYIETLRALSTSGEYDLSDPNDQERLYGDAKQKARVITAMRALGQFFGPTSPSPEFKIETESGDMYASQLVKEFQKLQADNYDTAVSEFLRIYGNDAILYLSNKTESVAGGLEATDQFGDWERRHGGLFNQYPSVAGFMAPGGDDFSFEVWSRQLEQGKRRRLTDREIVALAQYRAASAQYRALRDQLPANPSQDQKTWLRSWRVELNKEYPGFPVVAEFNPGEFPAKIDALKRMVQEPALADNDVAGAVSQYLEARDSALASAAQAGYTSLASTAATPLREWLMGVAKALKTETPEFARIYDRLLSNEVED